MYARDALATSFPEPSLFLEKVIEKKRRSGNKVVHLTIGCVLSCCLAKSAIFRTHFAQFNIVYRLLTRSNKNYLLNIFGQLSTTAYFLFCVSFRWQSIFVTLKGSNKICFHYVQDFTLNFFSSEKNSL